MIALSLPGWGATVKVFLLAGQSNMVGTGNITELPSELKAAQQRVIIYTAGTYSYGWTMLQPGTGASTGTFGPEVSFGRDMSAAFPSETLAIIKVAWIGSALAYDWRPPSAGGSVGQYYTTFVNEVRKALAAFPSGNTPEIRGMCWMQGESDASNIYPASEYESNLRCFIQDVRAEFGVQTMPFVIAMIDKTSSWVEYEVVRQAEIAVAASVPYVGIFDTYGMATDGSHYKPAGLIAMGQEFASSMLGFLTGSATPAPTSQPGTPGDVNSSGAVDIVDALLVAQYYVGLNPSGFAATRADVNASGTIDIVDALKIAQYYVGLIPGF